MCKSTKKILAIIMMAACATIALVLLFLVPCLNKGASPSTPESSNAPVQQKSVPAIHQTVVSQTTPPPSTPSVPQDLVGNLPMAPLSGKGFTSNTLFGYNNPQALITAVHQKTLRILSQGGNLKPVVLQMALRAYVCARAQNLGKSRYISIIDYSLPSTTQRMWVIDLRTATVSYHTLVAHGKNSGFIYTTSFSNSPGSDASSIGLFLTGNTYIGHNGYSLKLKGLEKGFNDNALEREVVIHGAAYVSDSFLKASGRIGRSWGCPALSKAVSTPVINEIKDGTLVFAYYPQQNWENKSTYLHCSVALPWSW